MEQPTDSREVSAKSPSLARSWFKLGVSYYPDYLPSGEGLAFDVDAERVRSVDVKEHIRLDLRRMQRLGLAKIRMGEFAWASVEPRPGEYSLERFEWALDAAREHDLEVLMCTPTATPPQWLVQRHPEMLPRTRHGQTVGFGGRRHYDPTHQGFLEASDSITSVFGEAFGAHPAVTGWQIDNELGNHGSWELHSEAAKQAFQQWLSQQFAGDIKALNEAWFSSFWSMGYLSFADIDTPKSSWVDPNPHLELAFRRFCTEPYLELQRRQKAILRRSAPQRPITTNITPMFFDLDWWRMRADWDFVAYDHYQCEAEPDPVSSSTQFNLMRSLSADQSFAIVEQQPTQVNWQKTNKRIAMDWLPLWAAQSLFLGGREMLYFSWQRFHGGSEQYHDGILPHDVRVPVSDQEKTIMAKQQWLQEMQALLGGKGCAELKPRADVLCVHSLESRWLHHISAQTEHWNSIKVIDRVQAMCSRMGLGLQFVGGLAECGLSLADLCKYRLLVFPGYGFALTESERRMIAEYQAQGGKVMSWPRSFVCDRHGQMLQRPFALYGGDEQDSRSSRDELVLSEFGALGRNERDGVSIEGGERNLSLHMQGDIWSERWRPAATQESNWQAWGHFDRGPYKGEAGLLYRPQGLGGHLHFGILPVLDEDFFQFMSDWLQEPFQRAASQHVQVFPLEVPGESRFFGLLNTSVDCQHACLPSLPCPGTSDQKVWSCFSWSLQSDFHWSKKQFERSGLSDINLEPRSITVAMTQPRKAT